MVTDFKKLIILGNSGSGKTFLAQKLSSFFNLPVIHLDKLFWESENCFQKRPKEKVHKEVLEIIEGERWILEGVFGDLAHIATYKADALIFLNIDWSECKKGLLLRGPQGATEENFKELLNWAELYWNRKTMSSFEGHEKIFEHFHGPKMAFTSRNEVEEWLSFINSHCRV